MKNFRKVLALVLVVATLFSFAAMAGAKSLSDYEDADKVNYDVAVDVLSTLGVLNGYEDDTFKPTATISREEMAKMIAVLANTGDDISKLYASANAFADVESDRWSASYIAYCAQTGIVAGRTADTFDPTGKVTGLETAKMLLVVMGFSAQEQGYVDANWKINVLRDAKNCGLLNGFETGYDVEAAITREEAANMMLNALQGNVIVGVLSENILKVTNTLYTKWQGTLLDSTNLNKHGFAKLYGNVIVAENTLLEALYGGKLTYVPSADCFGRPGGYWSFTNSKNKEQTDKVLRVATPAFESTTGVDFSKVLKDEFNNSEVYSMDVFVDGEKTAASVTTFDGDEDMDRLTAMEASIGKGTLVEIYVNDSARKITVVVINTYIGEVIATTKNGQTFYVEGCNGKLSASNKTYGFEEGDVVLYWICNGGKDQYTATLHSAELAKSVIGLAKRGTTNAGNPEKSTVTLDATSYEYAENFGHCYADVDNRIPMGVEEVQASNDGQKYIIYLDKTGYIMGWAEYEEDAEYTYAYAIEETGGQSNWVGNGKGEYGYANNTRDMAYFDGSVKEDVATTELTWDATNNVYNLWTDGFGTLLRYVENTKGEADADLNADEDIHAGYYGEFAQRLDAGFELKKNGNLTDGDITIYGTTDTKYMVRTWNYADQKFDYTVYGAGELPQTFKSVTGNVQVFLDEDNANPNLDYASYIFFDAAYAVVTQRAFVVSYKESVTDSKFADIIGAYDAYNAVIGGEEAILAVTDDELIASFVAGDNQVVCALFTLKLQCLGLDDNGTPVYALAKYEFATTYVALRLFKGKLEYKSGNEWKAADLDKDAFGAAAFPAGYSFDDGVTTVFADILDNTDEIMNYYESKAAMEEADSDELYFPGAAWLIDADEDGDFDEVYFNVFSGETYQ